MRSKKRIVPPRSSQILRVFHLLLAFLLFSQFLLFLPGRAIAAESLSEVYNLRYHTHPNFTRIVIDTGSLREYTSAELKLPDRIFVDIYQAKLNPILLGKVIAVGSGYLSQIRIGAKTPTTVRIAADVDFTKVDHYRVFHLFDPFRVVIDIYPKLAEPAPAEPAEEQPAQPPEPVESGYTMARQLGLGIRTVVIDPGHGGTDPGCIGKAGLKEKETVLKVALALKDLLLARKDLDVIMTRETDIYIPLEDRTVIANQRKADLFISIHANANRNRKREGVETFYLNFSPDPLINEIAARENATSTKNISEMKTIIQKIVQNSKIYESKALAEKIQDRLVAKLSAGSGSVKNLGVKGGPFWVLIGGEMPSILVEISHLSNPAEEQKLKTADYCNRIAQGIYDGILEYMHSLGKG